MEGSRKLGIVRVYALVFGIAYLAVAALEVGLRVFGSGSLVVGSQTILKITPAQNAFDTRQALLNAMDGHVLGKAVLVARFHRQ